MKKNVGFHFFKVWERRANFEMLKVVKEMEEVKEERVSQDPDPLPLPSKSSDFYKYWNLK